MILAAMTRKLYEGHSSGNHQAKVSGITFYCRYSYTVRSVSGYISKGNCKVMVTEFSKSGRLEF